MAKANSEIFWRTKSKDSRDTTRHVDQTKMGEKAQANWNDSFDRYEIYDSREVPELDPAKFGLSNFGFQEHNLMGILNVGKETATTAEAINLLETLYCNNIAAEFQHCGVCAITVRFSLLKS